MDEFKTSDQLKEFILNYGNDSEEELVGSVGPCYGLSWKKDSWVVRQNNKKVGVVESKDLPRGFDLQDSQLISSMLKVLRKTGMDGLTKYLRAFKRTAKQEGK